MIPPFFMKMHIVESGKTKVRLWIPIFLVWLILLIIAIALAPIIFLLALVFWPRSHGKKILMFGPMFFYLVSKLHGLNIHTQSPDDQVHISFN